MKSQCSLYFLLLTLKIIFYKKELQRSESCDSHSGATGPIHGKCFWHCTSGKIGRYIRAFCGSPEAFSNICAPTERIQYKKKLANTPTLLQKTSNCSYSAMFKPRRYSGLLKTKGDSSSIPFKVLLLTKRNLCHHFSSKPCSNDQF